MHARHSWSKGDENPQAKLASKHAAARLPLRAGPAKPPCRHLQEHNADHIII